MSYDIALAKNADVFYFNYADIDLAGMFVYDMNDWGSYLVDNVSVTDAVRPITGDDLLSDSGSWTVSVPLSQFDNVSSARVIWEGVDVTAEYSLNDGAWTALSPNQQIIMDNNDDFDIRFSFAGGESDDPAQLTSVTVRVLATPTLYSATEQRPLSLTNASINGVFSGSGTVGVAPENDLIGTIEMWVTPTTTSPLTTPASTTYVNGVAGTPTAGVRQHLVRVLTTEANVSFTINSSEVEYLALYPFKMTAAEVATLYAAQQGQSALTVVDSSAIGVTEGSPAVDIYAYVWTTTGS